MQQGGINAATDRKRLAREITFVADARGFARSAI
jgi:hypothetical protein